MCTYILFGVYAAELLQYKLSVIIYENGQS